MPELPEVEVVKRSLFKMVNKAKILNIKIKNKNLRYKIAHDFSRLLIDKKILKISRRSKYLIFHFNEKILLVHFGMTGKLLIMRESDKAIFKTSFYYSSNITEKHNHIYFYLDNGLVLIYNDVRRFGFLKIYNTTNLKKNVFFKKLGLEPFSKKFNFKYFKMFIENKKKNIKNLLMDQTFVSGLGNIYVNEVLYMSKINPLRNCSTLNTNDIKNLIYNIRKVLKFSISKGGASIKDFKNAVGETGSFQQFFYVYGQKDNICARISCKGKIKKIIISNRSSFYCNKCQK